MKRVDFDDYADNYEELAIENVNFFSRDDSYFARSKIHLVKKYIQREPNKILEYGAGIGRNLRFLIECFQRSEIWACDISEKSLKKINTNYPTVNTFLLRGGISLTTSVYDLVFIAGVYHHIEPFSRRAVTAQIVNLMGERGELFVFEHNPYNPVTRRLVDRCPYDEDAVLLKPFELRKLLIAAGLYIQKTKYYLFFPPVLRLGKLEILLSAIPLGGQYFVKAIKS
jgi:SAM-dependent methyltransferase